MTAVMVVSVAAVAVIVPTFTPALVVVEDADSVLHGLISQDASFVKIFDADGTVWVNTARGREFCQRRDR